MLNQDLISCNPSFTQILTLIIQCFSIVFSPTLYLTAKAASKSKLKQGISGFIDPTPSALKGNNTIQICYRKNQILCLQENRLVFRQTKSSGFV